MADLGKQVFRALKASLRRPCPIDELMEMRWTLLLLIDLFSKMSEQQVPDQDTWVRKITETAGTNLTDTEMRVKTGQIVAEIVAGCPWGFEMTSDNSTFVANQSVMAIFHGMVKFAREIKRTVDKRVPAADQKRYDVEEAWSTDDEDQGPIPGYEPDQKEDVQSPAQSPAHSPAQSPQSSGNSGTKLRTRNNNPNYPRGLFWTPKENIALLKQYLKAAPLADGKPATHQQVADLHNASYFPDGSYARSKVALQQQMKILVGVGRQGIEAKIAELESELKKK